MLYNLRSDIIYYKTGSDFELEFNLCGCCRMRLLTDKPSNKKGLVHSLARAVSRSRVILIAGPLFGDESSIEIVAQALGTTTEIVNNNTYNIASDEEIEIIKGSLPLVSSDGSFGGCIIESGPQTMILLTDNKTLRKNIMSNLIHPYIAELYTAEMQSNSKPTFADEKTAGDNDKADQNEIISTDETDEAFEEVIITEPDEIDTQIIEATEEDQHEEDPDFALLFVNDENGGGYNDIRPEDIFIEQTDSENDDYVPHKDITIDDLFPSSPEMAEPARTIDEKLEEADIVLENDEYIGGELPEEYVKTYDNLFINNDSEDEKPVEHLDLADEFKFLDDEGEIIGNMETVFENRKSGISIATIIFTIILLLSIITLCICIFTASKNEGLAPSEYIRSIFGTLFG